MTSNHPGAKVEIYTRVYCGYCIHAKQLLRNKNIDFVEYAIDGNEQARRQMMERAEGRCSLPQIFINDLGIGGYIELKQLDDGGQLDNMLCSYAGVNANFGQGSP